MAIIGLFGRRPVARVVRGFTIVELIVAMAIMVTLALVVITNFRVGEKIANMAGATDDLMQSLRNAQAMALSGQKFSGVTPGGFGIYMQTTAGNNARYVKYADSDSNHAYTGVGEALPNGSVTFPTGVYLQSVTPAGGALDIFFSITTGTIYVNGAQSVTDAQVIVAHSALSTQKVIIISPVSGLIRVQ